MYLICVGTGGSVISGKCSVVVGGSDMPLADDEGSASDAEVSKIDFSSRFLYAVVFFSFYIILVNLSLPNLVYCDFCTYIISLIRY